MLLSVGDIDIRLCLLFTASERMADKSGINKMNLHVFEDNCPAYLGWLAVNFYT